MLGPVVDRSLQGHVLHAISGTVRVQGRDAAGRTLACPATGAGKDLEGAALVDVTGWREMGRVVAVGGNR